MIDRGCRGDATCGSPHIRRLAPGGSPTVARRSCKPYSKWIDSNAVRRKRTTFIISIDQDCADQAGEGVVAGTDDLGWTLSSEFYSNLRSAGKSADCMSLFARKCATKSDAASSAAQPSPIL
jgi:hypothetical protein